MSVEEVLEAVTMDEEEYDLEEPMMEGSDDEFSVILGEEESDDDIDDETPAPPVLHSHTLSRSSTSVPDSPTLGHSSSPVPDSPTIGRSSSPVPDSPTPTQQSTGSPSPSSTAAPSLPTSWSSRLQSIVIEPFSTPVGPTTAIPESPLEVFQLFFGDDLVQVIVEESNRYAREVMGDEKYDTWRVITADEVKAYLGFSILMGIVQLPSLDDYWKRDPLLHYAPIADRISRDRFRDISRYLHFVDNSTLSPRDSPGYDRLGKIRPLINYFCTKFAELYNPHKEVAVDEAMIKFQGRSSLKQFMPLKPIKRGIKVWVLGDSNNGYFSKLEVYTGKGASAEKGLGTRVVKELTSELKGKNHHVFFDNFFTNHNLLADLVKDGIYSCGTARKDRRGFPEELKGAKLSKR